MPKRQRKGGKGRGGRGGEEMERRTSAVDEKFVMGQEHPQQIWRTFFFGQGWAICLGQ